MNETMDEEQTKRWTVRRKSTPALEIIREKNYRNADQPPIQPGADGD